MKHLVWLCLLSPLAAQMPINSDVSVKGASKLQARTPIDLDSSATAAS